jgi:predicted GIY-YIG superfamily endonuclease
MEETLVMEKNMTQLYRHYDSQDNLLYVGISKSAINRLSQHFRTAEWFKDIARISVENFATREEALEAEKLAIKTEYPWYNKTHNTEVIEPNVSFVYQASNTNLCLRNITSIVTFKVWQELLHYLATLPDSKNSSTINIEHSFIAKTLNIDSSGVTKAISDLKKVGLVLDLKQRKKITINPLYAWNGNLRLWQETVEDYLAKGIITLPTNQPSGDNHD